MRSMRPLLALGLVFHETAQSLDEFNSSQCVDSVANDFDCTKACDCGMMATQIGCVIESCWNKNLFGAVFGNILEQITSVSRASQELAFTNPAQGLRNITGCQCCSACGAISAGYNTCPDTDPSPLGVRKFVEMVIATPDGQGFESCDSTLDEFDCIADLQFPQLIDDGEYYADSSLPTSGGQSLFNTGGLLTTPPMGLVTTISIGVSAVVLTAAPYTTHREGGDDADEDNGQRGGNDPHRGDYGNGFQTGGEDPGETEAPGTSSARRLSDTPYAAVLFGCVMLLFVLC
ncbi:hypothetical protein HJFPF1_06017 [Paramyrothecium foliicola]|nr:hypothetical protein HJFPF1_06017 [Paramyrothecium foliicola]